MFRAASIVLAGLVFGVLVTSPPTGVAQETGETGETEKLAQWLSDWAFVVGDWVLVEKRYGFDGELIQTNTGRSRFRWVMQKQRIEELQTIVREDARTSHALHVFVYDPRSEEIEIARTDSGHYGFSLLIGSPTGTGMRLGEKHPNPQSDVTRRVTYTRAGEDHFSRQLEFSTDGGKTFFVRSEWTYSRAP